MKEALNWIVEKTPRSVIVIVLMALGAGVWAGARYAVNDKLQDVVKNAESIYEHELQIRALTESTTRLVEATANLKETVQALREDSRLVREDGSRQLQTVQQLIDQLNRRLDRLENQ